MMFAKRMRACTKCGVYFKPRPLETRWGDLCEPHRDEIKPIDLRRDAVVSWATAHWVRLEPQYLEEKAATEAAYSYGGGGGGSYFSSLGNTNVAQDIIFGPYGRPPR